MKLAVAVQTPEIDHSIPVALLTGSLEEKLEKAAALGADGVELMVAEPRRLDPLRFSDALNTCGLEVAAIGSGAVPAVTGYRLLHSDQAIASAAKQRLQELIEFSAEVRSPLVTIGSFRGRLGDQGAEGREHLKQILCESADYALSQDVRLVLEPLNRYESDIVLNAEEGLSFLKEAGSPGLGLLLDTYHMNIEESSWTTPLRQAEQAGVLWHIHLGDSNRLPPGQGHIDFSVIVDTLKDLGYGGYLSAELLALPDPDMAAKTTITYMQSLMEQS